MATVWLSGYTGRAVVEENGKIHVIEIADTGDVRESGPWVKDQLLQYAPDLLKLNTEDPYPYVAIGNRLLAEWSRDRALYLLLLSLDRELSTDLRRRAAEALQKLLTHHDIISYVRERLRSSPFPYSDADVAVVTELPTIQRLIGSVVKAAEAQPMSKFEEPEWPVLSQALRSAFGLFSSDLAIDLGTTNTLVYVKGQGIVVNEPSIVAINKTTGDIEAVGIEAKEMLGRAPGNIVTILPVKDGVIADFKVTERMLSYFIQKARGRKMLAHPRVVIGVPNEITQVEKRSVIDSAYRAGASEVYLVDDVMVAAIGAGLPITEPSGHMVVDIGGGTTDVAVISLSGIVYSRSVRVAGNEMDEAIVQYLKRKYNLLIGERNAEQIKIQVGSAFPLDRPLTMEVKGRNLLEGAMETITINDAEIRESLNECVTTIINAIRLAVERTPPELSSGISDHGIVLTGGGALIRNLDKRVQHDIGIPVRYAQDPFASSVLGTATLLTETTLLQRLAVAHSVR